MRFYRKKENLSHKVRCRVYGDAQVFDKAKASGKARVSNKFIVFDEAKVCGRGKVFNKAIVCDKARVSGRDRVSTKLGLPGISTFMIILGVSLMMLGFWLLL